MKPRSKNFIGNMLEQILKSCYSNILINKCGSRATNNYRRNSDLDYEFSFPGSGISKSDAIQKVIMCLNKSSRLYPNGEKLNFKEGTNGKVINVHPRMGNKISFAHKYA